MADTVRIGSEAAGLKGRAEPRRMLDALRTLTDFVVDAAVVEAERLLADRTQFVLEADQWSRFVELLDRAPQENPGLEKLFAKPSVFTAE